MVDLLFAPYLAQFYAEIAGLFIGSMVAIFLAGRFA